VAKEIFASEGDPAMEGELVRLRGYEKSDLEAVMKWVNDEEVTKFLAGPVLRYPLSSVAEERFIEASANPDSPNKTFVIETLTARKYIGALDLHAIDWHNRRAEVGIVIGDKSYWNKGYGTDAMRLALRLAFDRLNLHRVSLRVFEYNRRAIRSYEKCGFRHEGVLRDDRFHAGHYYDTLVMGILSSEYRASGSVAARRRPAPKGAPREGSLPRRRKS
jgi:RimJ/RimL family protein N-acetyltransferase